MAESHPSGCHTYCAVFPYGNAQVTAQLLPDKLPQSGLTASQLPLIPQSASLTAPSGRGLEREPLRRNATQKGSLSEGAGTRSVTEGVTLSSNMHR